jgi:hypothetical protein
MKLTSVHQVLVIGTILLCALLALRSVTVGEHILALGAVAVAGVAGLYLRKFRRKLRAAESATG